MFIVLDSIDGAGKGKQREEVTALLAENSDIEIKSIGFPVHDIFYESIIHPALQEERTLSKSSWVLSYLLDKTLHSEKIEPFLSKKNNLMIADGYLTTTIAYQSFLMGQVKLEKLLQYAEDFEIPKPDLAIFIDADPEIAFARKMKEEGHDEGLDLFEKSLDKQKKLQSIFRKMAQENVYCDWVVVNGNGTIEEVRDVIIKIIENKLIS